MIPKVRDWRVTYWRIDDDGTEHTKLASCTVSAVNKSFAKWAAQGKIGYPATYTHGLIYPFSYIRVTVSVIRRAR